MSKVKVTTTTTLFDVLSAFSFRWILLTMFLILRQMLKCVLILKQMNKCTLSILVYILFLHRQCNISIHRDISIHRYFGFFCEIEIQILNRNLNGGKIGYTLNIYCYPWTEHSCIIQENTPVCSTFGTSL